MTNPDLNRYGQEQQTADGMPYVIAEFAFDSETCAWHYMRPRTDKKKPNFRNTVLPGLLDIGLNISKEELMCVSFLSCVYFSNLIVLGGRYRLLCAEREDKAGDKWRQEMQDARKRAFDRKKLEPHQGSAAPPRQQQRLSAEGGGAAAGK
jgi:hypothetical protein